LAINAKDVVISFNSLLDKVTAEDLTNYVVKVNNATALTAGTDYTVEVDEKDAKKVNVVLSDAKSLNHGDYLTVTVKKTVLTNLLKGLEKDSVTSSTFTDTAAPTVVKSEINGADIVVTFDDYVTKVGLVKVNNNSVDVTALNAALALNASKTVTLAGAATGLATGSHTVSLGNVTDFNANNTVFVTSAVTVSDDTVKPSVASLTKLGQYSFVMKFNKEVTAPVITAKKNGYGLTVVSVVAKDGAGTDDEYVVTVDNALPVEVYAAGETSVNLALTATGYQSVSNDMYGDVFAGSVTLTTDTVAPTVVTRFSKVVERGIVGSEDQGFEFQFSEILDPATIDETKVVLKNKDGVRLDPANYTVTVVADADAALTKLRVESTDVDTVTGIIDAGTYTVELGAGTVADSAGNVNASTSVTFTKSGAVSTDIDLTGAITAAGNTIDIAYGEIMTNSATTLSNYKLDNKALPAGTLIYFDGDKTKVQIKLPAGSIVSTSDVLFTISSSVVGEDGSEIEAADLNTVLTGLLDNVKPVLVSATKVDGTHIKLTFNEALAIQGADDALLQNDVVIKVNGSTLAVTGNAVTAANAKSIVLTVAAYNTAQSITVTTATGSATLILNLADVQGNLITSGTTVTAN
jgi:hypothetical protein